jgi:hypothetical protein
MITKRQAVRFIFLACAALVIIAIGLFARGKVLQANAQENQPEAPSAPDGYLCTVDNIAVYANRIHIKCNPPINSISYFATSSDSSNMIHANRYLTLATTAFALSKPLYIGYDTNSAHNPSGCMTSDCRKITEVTMTK